MMEKAVLFFYGFISVGIMFSWLFGFLLKMKSPVFLSGILLHSLFIVLVVHENFPEYILLFSSLLYPVFGIFLSSKSHNLESLFFFCRKTSCLALIIITIGFGLWVLNINRIILFSSPILFLFYIWNLSNYVINAWDRTLNLNKGIWIAVIFFHSVLSFNTLLFLINHETITSCFLLILGLNSLISLTIVYIYLKTYYDSLESDEKENELLYLKKMSALNANKILNERLLSLNNKALNNQINPHFLFNAINSINSLIITSEIRKAKTYLVKLNEFLGLTFSEKNSSFYTLQEELNLLELYLRLENLRRDHTIQLHIVNSLTLNISDFFVPHLFLQSIIENSIIHGLDESENGKIIIKLENLNNMVHITISDNGSGLKTKQESRNKINYKSAGLEILKTRLTSLEEHYRKTCLFEIKNIENKPGTETFLTFPVINTPPKFKML